MALSGCSSSDPLPVPPATGNVTDTADVLSDDQEQELERVIEAGNDSTGNARVAVLTEEDAGGDLEDRARAVATAWGVGDKGEDNGVLVLLAVEDREVRIEVADGAREHLDDDDAAAIVEDTMVPEFEDENYGAGLIEGTRMIYETASGQRDPVAESEAGGSNNAVMWIVIVMTGLAVVVGVIVVASVVVDRRRKRTAQQFLEQARREDPDLQLTEQQEEDYVRWARGQRMANISTVALWLPLYAQEPSNYGAAPPPSSSGDPGAGGGSSFGGGGGFSGGGAGGSW